MGKRNHKWVLWVAMALVVAALTVLPMLAENREMPSNVQASIQTAKAAYRDVDTVLVGGGQLSSSGVYNIKIPENIKIKKFLVGNGDTVLEGDAIAQIDSVSVMTAITKVQDTLKELSKQINSADQTASSSAIKSSPSGRVKKLYAQAGDSVEEVMLKYGALAILSLDDEMEVKLKSNKAISPGDKVTVSVAESTVTGRVKSNVSGELTITVTDGGYEIGSMASVFTQDGAELGSGELQISNAWKVTAYSGTVSKVHVKEEQSVYANYTLFTVTEAGKNVEYQKAIDKRHKYEALIQELFQMYRSGVITVPCDGIVSGIDTEGSYMLSWGSPGTGADSSGIRLTLLSNVTAPVQIILKPETLPSGAVGEIYVAALQASDGTNPVSGIWAADGLPAGLSLDSNSGLISGTPTVSGQFTIRIGFAYGENNQEIRTTECTLTIEEGKQKELYSGYLAQVTEAGGNVIKVKQTAYPYTISNLDSLPSVNTDVSAMTEEAVYSGQAIVDGHFAAGDLLWIVLDNNGVLCMASKIEGEGGGNRPGGETPNGGRPSGSSGGGENRPGEETPNEGGRPSGGFGGGMSGGFGGGGMPSGTGNSAQAEDDGLYSLETVTVAAVTSQERMSITISVDEMDITKVYVGQTAQIAMNYLAGEPVEAVVKKISNSGENSGGNSKFSVELELEKSSEMLPGMSATSTIILDTAENVLCVPAAAIYELDGDTVVYTAYDEKSGTLGNPVSVTIGSADADFVQILSGLDEDSTVYYKTYEASGIPEMPTV